MFIITMFTFSGVFYGLAIENRNTNGRNMYTDLQVFKNKMTFAILLLFMFFLIV